MSFYFSKQRNVSHKKERTQNLVFKDGDSSTHSLMCKASPMMILCTFASVIDDKVGRLTGRHLQGSSEQQRNRLMVAACCLPTQRAFSCARKLHGVKRGGLLLAEAYLVDRLPVLYFVQN